MGFVTIDLSKESAAGLMDLQSEILAVLDDAAARLQSGDSNSARYFGSSTNAWINLLKTKLRRFAKVFRERNFVVGYEDPDAMQTTGFAAAHKPHTGWHDRTRDSVGSTGAGGTKSFFMELDFGYITAPVHRVSGNMDSKFQTLVHELSHQILGTQDLRYGVVNCMNLAVASAHAAQNNADNWGYFLEAYFETGPTHPGSAYGCPPVPPPLIRRPTAATPPTPPPKIKKA